MPESTSESAAEVTWIAFSAGSSWASFACNAPVSMPTAMSTIVQRPALSCRIMLVAPTSTPSRYSTCGESSRTCATSSLPMVRSVIACGSFSTVDLPATRLTATGGGISSMHTGARVAGGAAIAASASAGAGFFADVPAALGAAPTFVAAVAEPLPWAPPSAPPSTSPSRWRNRPPRIRRPLAPVPVRRGPADYPEVPPRQCPGRERGWRMDSVDACSCSCSMT